MPNSESGFAALPHTLYVISTANGKELSRPLAWLGMSEPAVSLHSPQTEQRWFYGLNLLGKTPAAPTSRIPRLPKVIVSEGRDFTLYDYLL